MKHGDISDVTLIAGNAHPALAKAISSHLPIPLLKTHISKFSDGEIQVELLESVRGTHVYIIQPTCIPTHDNIMELILITDAAKRAGCDTVTAVIPYYGYSRQDRRNDKARTPISSRVIATMLEAAGVDAIITLDIHSTQQLGFFSIPAINISASMKITADIWRACGNTDYIIVSPDVGGVTRARAIAKLLNDSNLAIVDKRRPSANVSEVMNIIGDVANKKCILIDDMVDTAGTLCKAAKALMDKGASSVTAYCTHPILSGKAIQNIEQSVLSEVVVTDTIPMMFSSKKIRVVTISDIIAETIYRLNTQQSITEIQE
jgi:ribose-phosphate pyrophosphokinase